MSSPNYSAPLLPEPLLEALEMPVFPFLMHFFPFYLVVAVAAHVCHDIKMLQKYIVLTIVKV